MGRPSWVDLLADAARSWDQPEEARRSRVGPMLGLTVVLPALLFSVVTVMLAAREEGALRPDLEIGRAHV